MKKRRLISELMIVEVYLGLKIPATSTLTIQEKSLMVMGDLHIGPVPAILHPKEDIVE